MIDIAPRGRYSPSILTMTALLMIGIVMILTTIRIDINPNVATLARQHGESEQISPSSWNICTSSGIQGYLRPNSVVTFITTPKPHGESGMDKRQMKFVMRSWVMLDRVDIIVMSTHCSIIKMAHDMGLATVVANPSSDLEGLTYRHALKQLATQIPTKSPLIGFCNSDIMFDSSLADSLDHIIAYAEQDRLNRPNKWESIFVVGQRTNVDVAEAQLLEPLFDETYQSIFDRAKSMKLFGGYSQDYFIFTKSIDIKWDQFPPFMIGGVYFDNWFTGLASRMPTIAMIDASVTALTVHVNHGDDPLQSHANIASEINLLIRSKLDRVAVGIGTDHLSMYTNWTGPNDITVQVRNK